MVINFWNNFNAYMFFIILHATRPVTQEKFFQADGRPNLEKEIKIFLQSSLNRLVTQRTPYIEKHTDVCTSSQGSNNTSHSTAFLLHKLMWDSSVSISEPWKPDAEALIKPTFFLSTIFTYSFSREWTSFSPKKVNLKIISEKMMYSI